MELVDVMSRRMISIASLYETKWVGEKSRKIENTRYKFYYAGKDRRRNGVEIILFKHLNNYVVAIKRIVDRILLIKLMVEMCMFPSVETCGQCNIILGIFEINSP